MVPILKETITLAPDTTIVSWIHPYPKQPEALQATVMFITTGKSLTYHTKPHPSTPSANNARNVLVEEVKEQYKLHMATADLG